MRNPDLSTPIIMLTAYHTFTIPHSTAISGLGGFRAEPTLREHLNKQMQPSHLCSESIGFNVFQQFLAHIAPKPFYSTEMKENKESDVFSGPDVSNEQK